MKLLFIFVIAVVPLLVVLHKVNAHYELRKTSPRLNHHIFMGDLKLFVKTEPETERLAETANMQQVYWDGIQHL